MRKSFSFLCLLLANSVYGADCSTVVGSNDDMLFEVRKITISRSCVDFTITLKHHGRAAKEIMGHNLVITKVKDLEGLALEGQKYGIDNDYLVPNDKRIIAHTKMIGGGESDTITFKVANFAADTKYGYICTYPGHFVMMRGAIELVD